MCRLKLDQVGDGRAQFTVGHRFVQQEVPAGLRFLQSVWRSVTGNEHAGNLVVVLAAQTLDHSAAGFVVAQTTSRP